MGWWPRDIEHKAATSRIDAALRFRRLHAMMRERSASSCMIKFLTSRDDRQLPAYRQEKMVSLKIFAQRPNSTRADAEYFVGPARRHA